MLLDPDLGPPQSGSGSCLLLGLIQRDMPQQIGGILGLHFRLATNFSIRYNMYIGRSGRVEIHT